MHAISTLHSFICTSELCISLFRGPKWAAVIKVSAVNMSHYFLAWGPEQRQMHQSIPLHALVAARANSTLECRGCSTANCCCMGVGCSLLMILAKQKLLSAFSYPQEHTQTPLQPFSRPKVQLHWAEAK